MKILLISPGCSDDIDSQITRGIPYLFAKTLFAPHAIAAVAALTPEEHEVTLHDEYAQGPVEPTIRGNTFDIIGISVTSNQKKRSQAIAGFSRKHSPKSIIVFGGIGLDQFIRHQIPDVDVIFLGEAEETWPQFLRDLKTGMFGRIYENVSKPDMTKTPAPRWELLSKEINSYAAVLLQTTRGCPFDCSFCDVIYTFGRKIRSKSIEQVLEEIRKINSLNVRRIFIADDNFAGDKKYTKELLKRMIPLNNSFKSPIEFSTQIDITIANEDELLSLLADCNFQAVMIGIESVNEMSLKDYNKQQNLRILIPEAVRKIQSYGIVVLAHMIIGADSDDASVFKKTGEFISEANIVHHLCHPLAAPPGTRMWYELKRAGRIIRTDHEQVADKLDIISNIIPKQMTRVELFEGLADYWESIYNPKEFTRRALKFIDGIKYNPKIKEPGITDLWMQRRMFWRVFTYFMFDVEKEQRKAFFTILRAAQRKGLYLLPKIIYIYTCYLIDYKRSMHDAKVARSHALWERQNGNCLDIDNDPVPVSEKIREHAGVLIQATYHHFRASITHRETLYKAIVTAMADFNDRFGNTFETFDELHSAHLKNTCDRITNQVLQKGDPAGEELPFVPGPGFTREIMDALDNAVRYCDHTGL